MRKGLIIATLPLFVMAACSESADDEAAPDDATAALESQAAGTGPYLVNYADGSSILAYSAADGTEWVATPPGPEHATWMVGEDGRACVDPPGEAEDGSDNAFCMTMSEIGEDGRWTVTGDNGGDPLPMWRIDKVATTPEDQVAPGTYIVEIPENGPALSVWAADGNAYLGLNAETGTWRAEGSQRCSKLDSEEVETCGAPTSEIGEDGSFTAEDAEMGTFTVRML